MVEFLFYFLLDRFLLPWCAILQFQIDVRSVMVFFQDLHWVLLFIVCQPFLPCSQSILFLFLPIYLVVVSQLLRPLFYLWFLATFIHHSFFCLFVLLLCYPRCTLTSLFLLQWNSKCVIPSQKFCKQMMPGKRTFAGNVLCCVLENSTWIFKNLLIPPAAPELCSHDSG